MYFRTIRDQRLSARRVFTASRTAVTTTLFEVVYSSSLGTALATLQMSDGETFANISESASKGNRSNEKSVLETSEEGVGLVRCALTRDSWRSCLCVVIAIGFVFIAFRFV